MFSPLVTVYEIDSGASQDEKRSKQQRVQVNQQGHTYDSEQLGCFEEEADERGRHQSQSDSDHRCSFRVKLRGFKQGRYWAGIGRSLHCRAKTPLSF